MKTQRIAIIGSGIAGLSAAYMLNKKQYDVTIFECNDYLGGHTNTITVEEPLQTLNIDTGFIVYNNRTYPNFIQFLNQLDVRSQKSDMSFSFSSPNIEYCGSTLNGLFSERKRLFDPKFYRFLSDVMKFNARAKHALTHDKIKQNCTLTDFIDEHRYGAYFYQNYLSPMASAIWSTPKSQVDQMPADFILSFYNHHGLLDISNRPQWFVIQNGSKQYVEKVKASLGMQKVRLNTAIKKISRTPQRVTVTHSNAEEHFDAVVLACHSDQALAMLEPPTGQEQNILNAIKFTQNTAYLHTDIRALPNAKRAWSSWNFIEHSDQSHSLTYYMNQLQSLKTDQHYCVSLNNSHIAPEKTLGTYHYEHPLYDNGSIRAKNHHHLINDQNRTFYVGAYWGNGFHEDGICSSLSALARLGVSL